MNRNFDTPTFQIKSWWNYGKNYSEKTEVFCGNEKNSEVETRSLIKLIKDNNIDYIFSFHNAGSDIISSNHELSKNLGKIYAENSKFDLITEDNWRLMKLTGSFKEWSEINNIPYLELEGSSRWGSDWMIQGSAIFAVLDHINSISVIK